MLSATQFPALRHVEATADARESRSLRSIAAILERAGYVLETYRAVIELLRQHARIALHFHPDRLGDEAASVAESLLRDGVYRNHFETGLSGGSPTAFPVGERDNWEGVLFDPSFTSPP